jgi:hypothetical protein
MLPFGITELSRMRANDYDDHGIDAVQNGGCQGAPGWSVF